MTQKLIFVYYLHQQCLVYLSRFYSRLLSVSINFFFSRTKEKKKQSPFSFLFVICINFNLSCLGYLLLTLLYTHNRVIHGFFHMSSCVCVCAFVYVNNLCVDVCYLTNNAKNTLSINDKIIAKIFNFSHEKKNTILIRREMVLIQIRLIKPSTR